MTAALGMLRRQLTGVIALVVVVSFYFATRLSDRFDGDDCATELGVRGSDRVVCHRGGLDVVSFRKGERKDDVAQRYLRAFEGEEGVLFVGKAQEKASVFRTEKRVNEAGVKYPWIIRSTVMVNYCCFL